MTKNPLDVALQAKTKLAAEKRAEEVDMIRRWQQDPTPQNMRPIMQQYTPLLKQKAIQWKAPGVDESAFHTKGQNLLVEAIKTYNPEAGAAPRTWIEHKLQPLKRFNIQQQNMRLIPEAKAERIGDVQTGTDFLKEELGREPTPQEIVDHLNPQLSPRQQLTPLKVQQIQQAQIKDLSESSFESDMVPNAISRERQIVSMLRPTLKPEQQEVYDYLYGQNGKPQVTSTSQLARLLKKSPPQVSRLRTAILKKYKEYA